MTQSDAKRSSSRPKQSPETPRHKERVEASHSNKKMTVTRHVAPKRFSHSAIGNR